MAESSDPLRIRPLTPADEAAWERFVFSCPDATFFHRVGWARVIRRAFGHTPHYLLAERHGEVCGVLPLVRVKSLLFGDTLASTPMCSYGGAVAVDDATRQALEEAASALARELGVEALELRRTTPAHPHWPTKDLYCTFRKAMAPTPEANLLAIPRKQRAEVRKGIQAGLRGVEDATPERCYALYSDSLHRLGTPVFTRRYFPILREEFGTDCHFFVVEREGEGVAAVVSFFFRDQVLPYYGGGLLQAREMGGMPFMYWDLMRVAWERGARNFDFGRSKRGSGSFEFKRLYGFEPQPLHYEYDLVRAQAMPEVNPMNPKFRLFIAGWKRLPLPMTRLLGPWLAKDLG